MWWRQLCAYRQTVALVEPLLPLILPVEDGVERTDDQTRRELNRVLVAEQRVDQGYHLKEQVREPGLSFSQKRVYNLKRNHLHSRGTFSDDRPH